MDKGNKIKTVLKSMGVGVTIPHLVELTDGRKYVLKFTGNPEGEKALINEVISYHIAKLLDLPIISCQVVEVDFSVDEIDLLGLDSRISKVNGFAFASLYNTKANPVNAPALFRIANNKLDALKIMIFDYLIGNGDRNKGNLLFDSKYKKILIIDHTHVFSLGTLWDEYQLPRKIGEEFTVESMNPYNYNNLIQFKSYGFDYRKTIDDFILCIKKISENDLKDIIESVRIFWSISKKEEEVLIAYLLDRIGRVDDIMRVLKL